MLLFYLLLLLFPHDDVGYARGIIEYSRLSKEDYDYVATHIDFSSTACINTNTYITIIAQQRGRTAFSALLNLPDDRPSRNGFV